MKTLLTTILIFIALNNFGQEKEKTIVYFCESYNDSIKVWSDYVLYVDTCDQDYVKGSEKEFLKVDQEIYVLKERINKLERNLIIQQTTIDFYRDMLIKLTAYMELMKKADSLETIKKATKL